MLSDIKHYPLYVQLSYVVGCGALIYVLISLVIGIYARLLRPGKNLKKQYGAWGNVSAPGKKNT